MAPPPREQVRPAELLAAVSLATDLGAGQPMEQALRTCYLAMGLACEVGLPVKDLFDTYYVSLLRFLGCTSEVSADASWIASSVCLRPRSQTSLIGRMSLIPDMNVQNVAIVRPVHALCASIASTS
jgi:hypothetical protein